MISLFFTLVAWLVQATAKGSVAIACIAMAYMLIGRRVRAGWWYAFWIVGVLRLVVPVAPASIWSIFNLVPPHPGIQLQLRGTAGQIVFGSIAGTIDVPWWIVSWKWLGLIWLCGFVVVATRALVATSRMHSLVRRAFEIGGPPPVAMRIVDAARHRLGIQCRVQVVESPDIDVPALHGVFRPTLLLPEGMCQSFATDELRHVILHELAHLRRHDIAVNWLLSAVRAIHWFNPLAWFAIARIEEERELACDALTLSCLDTHEHFGYGRTLVKLLERFRSPEPVPALVASVNQKRQMRRRLMMIGADATHSRRVLPLLALLSAIGLMALTDAPGRAGATLDPPAVRTLERLDGRINIDLTNASLSELVSTVAVKSGAIITQSPSIAASDAQHARFTLHTHNVPARAALTAALLPYGIVAVPAANAVRLTTGPPCLAGRHRTTKP